MPEQQSLFDDQPLPGEHLIPPGAQRGRCSSCDAELIWVTSKNGKPMPLAANTLRTIGEVQYATVHFADCKQGKAWSRKGRS